MRRTRHSIREAGRDRRGAEMTSGDTTEEIVAGASRQLRAPAAAGIAGILFAVLYTTGLVLLRTTPIYKADDAELGAAVRPWRRPVER